MENFKMYKVGERYEQFETHTDDIRFDITDSGAKLVVCFNGTQAHEV